jgi:formylglycine-generating enzyme required for sulfatase activity
VRQVKQHLEQRGIPCWMADNCIHSGEQFKTVIVKAIKQCDVFLFFSSEEANRSEWTIKEINTAVHLRKPIVPVKLDDAPYNDSILFDIGCLDYTDLSSITKLKPGLDKLETTLQGLLQIEPKHTTTRHILWLKPLLWSLAVLLLTGGLAVWYFFLRTPSVSTETLPNGNIVFTVDTVHFQMVKIQGGTFLMGSNTRDEDQFPQHQVEVSDYYLGETEVTQELWQTVMGENPSKNQGQANLPVGNVSWVQCQDFVKRLSQLTGYEFRLPTEAEWEYAAHGGKDGIDTLYAGSDILQEVTLYPKDYPRSGKRFVMSVRTAGKPNSLGLYDLTGNVWEFCNDRHGAYYTGFVSDPKGDSDERHERRIKRGGSWAKDTLSTLTITFRGSADTLEQRQDYGLRLCFDEN